MRSTVLAFLLLSARGGVAALAAWLVCRALRRAHAPSRLLCWLWLAVGLRFVLPWGIPLKLPRPESAPLAAAADTVQELGELPLLPPAPAAPAAAAPLPWYARLTPWHALAAVWLVGVLVLAVRGGIGYLKIKALCGAGLQNARRLLRRGVRAHAVHTGLCAPARLPAGQPARPGAAGCAAA